MITEELLQALLASDGSIRSQAETAFQSLPVLERLQGLVPFLTPDRTTTITTKVAVCQLAAVLCRRDIVKLSDVTILQEIVPPLLQAFSVNPKVGPCLGQVCASLSVLELNQQQQQSPPPMVVRNVMQHILNHVQPSFTATNAATSTTTTTTTTTENDKSNTLAALHLVATLAEEAPVIFTELATPQLPQWFQASSMLRRTGSDTHTNDIGHSHHYHYEAKKMAAWTNVMVQAAIATTVEGSGGGGGGTTNKTNPNVQPSTQSQPQPQQLDDIKVDLQSSMAATILAPYLFIPLLQWLQSFTTTTPTTTTTTTSSTDDEIRINEVIVEILQNLSQVSLKCPSLIAGPQTLNMLISTCLQLANHSNNHNNNDGNNVNNNDNDNGSDKSMISLQALQVLASILSVNDVKRHYLSSEQAMMIGHTAIPICAQLMKTFAGDVIDDEGWAEEPAMLVVNNFTGQGSGISDGRNDRDDSNNPHSQHPPQHHDDDEEDEYQFAMTLLGEFIATLGALNVVLPLAEQCFQSQPQSQSTQQQQQQQQQHPRVGLAILLVALEAAPVSFTAHLPVVVQAATTFASNHKNGNTIPNAMATSPRTHYQALRLLGSLCETHAEHLVDIPNNNEDTTVPQQILEVMMGAIHSKECTKLSTLACLGLVSFWRSPILAEHGMPVVGAVLKAMIEGGPLSWTGTDTGSVTVRVRAVGAIACIAQAIGEDFTLYYTSIMPGLLQMMAQSSSSSSLADLAAATMEAATIVGQAVGKDTFASDARQLMQWILPVLQQHQTPSSNNGSNDADDDDDSALLEPLLLACARIASVLGDDFVPYVDAVVPLLLQRIQRPPDMSVVEGNENDVAHDGTTESLTVPIPGKGFMKVTMNTTRIQEQAQAIRALYEHAKAMGASFSYVSQSMDILIPLVSFPYSSDVRSTCAQTLGAVFDAACLRGEEEGNMSAVQHYFPQLIEALSTQIPLEDSTDVEALYGVSDSLSEVYYIAHRYERSHPEVFSNFSIGQAEASVERCIESLVSCLKRRQQTTTFILQGSFTGDDEKQEYMDQLKSEQQLLTPLVDSIGYVLKLFKDAFLPLFEKFVVPILGPKLEDQTDVRATLSAICLFDDIVEHAGSMAATHYAPRLMEAIVKAMEQHSSEREVVQAGVYGIAQLARHAPSTVLAPHVPTILQKLLSLTSCPKEDAGDNLYLNEIAASALASLTVLGPFQDLKYIPQATLLNAFLSQLPILEDDKEAQFCHAGLCHLIENGIISVTDEATRLVKIIGELLVEVDQGEDVASPDTVERLSGILIQMQQQLAPVTLQQAFSGLHPEAQHVVGELFQRMGVSGTKIVTP